MIDQEIKARAIEKAIEAIVTWGRVDYNGVEWVVSLHDDFTADDLRKIADILEKANEPDETTNETEA